MNHTRLLDADVAIIGGGLTGTTLALLLERTGLTVILVEQVEPSKETRDDPRALAITRASENILNAAGAWDDLPVDVIGRIEKMQVWDAQGSGQIEFDSADLCEAVLGYIIPLSALERALSSQVQEVPGIQRIHARPDELTVEINHARLSLDNGQRLKVSLVVGADGSRSELRELAGIDYPRHDYQQKAVACRVKTEHAHRSVARQSFLPSGPLAFLPLADPCESGIVWSTTPEHAESLLSLDETAFNSELAHAFSHVLGDVLASTPRLAFPLYHAQARDYCRPRTALIGDAAHCVHPLAGQGANLGLLDAAALAEILEWSKLKGRDIGSLMVLRRYERWRMGENYLMIRLLQSFKYLFESPAWPLRFLRNTGLDAVNRSEFLKRALIRRASGLEGDLPRIARHAH